MMLKRRTFIAGLGATAAWPLAAGAVVACCCSIIKVRSEFPRFTLRLVVLYPNLRSVLSYDRRQPLDRLRPHFLVIYVARDDLMIPMVLEVNKVATEQD